MNRGRFFLPLIPVFFFCFFSCKSVPEAVPEDVPDDYDREELALDDRKDGMTAEIRDEPSLELPESILDQGDIFLPETPPPLAAIPDVLPEPEAPEPPAPPPPVAAVVPPPAAPPSRPPAPRPSAPPARPPAPPPAPRPSVPPAASPVPPPVQSEPPTPPPPAPPPVQAAPPAPQPPAPPPVQAAPPVSPSRLVRPADPIPPPPPARASIPLASPPPEQQVLISPVEPPPGPPKDTSSRTIHIMTGQTLEIPFRGTGWVYLGESASQRGMAYNSRRLDPEGQTFVFRAGEEGVYELQFYRQDFLRDYIINDLVKVIVEAVPVSRVLSEHPSDIPSERGALVAEPRWPSFLEEGAAEAVPAETSNETGAPAVADLPAAVSGPVPDKPAAESGAQRAAAVAPRAVPAAPRAAPVAPQAPAVTPRATPVVPQAPAVTPRTTPTVPLVVPVVPEVAPTVPLVPIVPQVPAVTPRTAPVAPQAPAVTPEAEPTDPWAVLAVPQVPAGAPRTVPVAPQAPAAAPQVAAVTPAAPPALTSAPPAAADTSSPMLPADLPADEYLRRAREEYDAGRLSPALNMLDQYRTRFPLGSDEALWLYAHIYEAPGASRNIRSALDYYRRLVNEYPQSQRYAEARRRIAYLERYYINIQ